MTDKPDAGEPVEPTTHGNPYDRSRDVRAHEGWIHGYDNGRAFERAARERSMGLRDRAERVLTTRSELCDELSDAFEDGRREALSEAKEARDAAREELREVIAGLREEATVPATAEMSNAFLLETVAKQLEALLAARKVGST